MCDIFVPFIQGEILQNLVINMKKKADNQQHNDIHKKQKKNTTTLLTFFYSQLITVLEVQYHHRNRIFCQKFQSNSVNSKQAITF